MEIGGCDLDLGLDGKPGLIGIPVDVSGDHSVDPTASLVFRMRIAQLFKTYAKSDTMGEDDLYLRMPELANESMAVAWLVSRGNRDFQGRDIYRDYLSSMVGARINRGCYREIPVYPVNEEKLTEISGQFKEITRSPIRITLLPPMA